MNFCVDGIGTTISVNQVEADGYEAQNLITSDLNLQSSRGFMTDTFVRPPVTISIKFPFCIELSHIVISPKVGKQSSSGFLIHTETSYKSWTKDHNGPVSTHLVAKEFVNTPVPGVITFRNPRFFLRRPFSALPTDQYSCYKNHDVMFNLKHPSFNACERVVGLDITILKVADSSVPAIGGLQVWGQPCIRCSQDQVEKLYKSWSRIIRRGDTTYFPPSLSQSDPPDEASPPKKQKLSSDSSLSVPEDFLDAITYEIMCQPIRLPCGLAVDAITLEKYYAEESKFGRLPNDPFTGITFTDTLKPVADSALKARIDLFITQNADDEMIMKLPRTLGPNRPSSQQQRNSYVFRNPNLCATSTISSTRKRQTTFSSSGFSNPDLFDKPIYAKEGKTYSSYSSSDLKDKSTVVSSSTQQSVDPEDQLNYELFKFLSSESSFYTTPKVSNSTRIKCEDCSLPINMKHGTSTFYIGLCDHIILCRGCLAKTDKQAHKTCKKCGVEWRAKDCLRIFI